MSQTNLTSFLVFALSSVFLFTMTACNEGGGGGGMQARIDSACEAECAQAFECDQGIAPDDFDEEDMAACVETCGAEVDELSSDESPKCLRTGVALQSCSANLACDERNDWLIECSAEMEAYETCDEEPLPEPTIDATQQCTGYCGQIVSCEMFHPSEEAECIQECVAEVENYEITVSQTCANSFIAAIQCATTVQCAQDPDDWFDDLETQCASQLVTYEDACFDDDDDVIIETNTGNGG